LGDAARQLGLDGDPWNSESTEAFVLRESKATSIQGVCRTCTRSMIYRRPHGDPTTVCMRLAGFESTK
jgi:hypothetical protein